MLYIYLGIVLLVYILIVIQGFRKKNLEVDDNPGKNIYSKAAFLVLLIPFWLIFFFKITTFIFDTYLDALDPIEQIQTVIIENDTEEPKEYLILQKHPDKAEWFHSYSLDEYSFQPIYKVPALATDTIMFRSDTNHSTRIYIMDMSQDSISADSTSFAKVFNHNEFPIKVFSSNFRWQVKTPDRNYELEYEYLALLIIALIGGIIHIIKTGGGWIIRTLSYLFNLILILASGFLAYNFAITIYNYYF